MSVKIGESVTIARDVHAYHAHPVLLQLHDGEWLVAFNHSRRWDRVRHPTEDPFYRTLMSRSSDHGQSWDEPYFVPDLQRSGTEIPGLAQLADGTVALSEYRYLWYPLPLARRLHEQGATVYLHLPGKNIWSDEIADSDWSHSLEPWARAPGGMRMWYSDDRGFTFTTQVSIDPHPFIEGCNRAGPMQLSNGWLMYAVIEQHVERDRRHVYALWSHDNGASWGEPTVVAHAADFGSGIGEPWICEVRPGELYCLLRGGGADSFARGFLYDSRSLDGGRTWSKPKPTELYGHPAHLCRVRDGRLVATYGRRDEPYGIYGCVSDDDGRSWRADEEFQVRDLPTSDLGYPTAIEFDDNRLFVAYYAQEDDGVTTIQGTYVTIA